MRSERSLADAMRVYQQPIADPQARVAEDAKDSRDHALRRPGMATCGERERLGNRVVQHRFDEQRQRSGMVVRSITQRDFKLDDPWQAGHRDDRRSRADVAREFKVVEGADKTAINTDTGIAPYPVPCATMGVYDPRNCQHRFARRQRIRQRRERLSVTVHVQMPD